MVMVSIIIEENDTNFIEKISIVFAFYFVKTHCTVDQPVVPHGPLHTP